MTTQEPLVRARGVRKSFGDVEVLKGIDFDVAPGEVSVIIGPSGSGKSTFLRAMNGLETISDGSLQVCGEEVGYTIADGQAHEWGDKQYAQFRSRIGMVFQRFNLYSHKDAAENVALSLIHVKGMKPKEAHDIAMTELERVGLADHAYKRPHQLSGGQQQRVAIARALALKPEVMLFDEPTSALDPELVGEVLEIMKELAAGGMTMVVVTHEIGFAREVGDSLAFFDQGVVVEKRPPNELLTDTSSIRIKNFLEAVK